MKSQIYCIKCLRSGRVYVGGSSHGARGRYRNHMSQLRRGVHKNKRLQDDFDEYGEECFEFSVLAECEPELLHKHEAEWCLKLGAYEKSRGYNVISAPNGGRTFINSSKRTHAYFRRVEPSMVSVLDGVLFGTTANDKVGVGEEEKGGAEVFNEMARVVREKSNRVEELELEVKRLNDDLLVIDAGRADLRAENAFLRAENERLIAGGVGVDVKMRGELERCKAKVKEYERMYNGS